MKRTIIALTSLLILGSCSDINDRTDIERLNLRGNIKSVSERSYVLEDKFGELVKGERTRVLSNRMSIYEYRYDFDKSFDKNGNLIVSTICTPGNYCGTYIYEHDKNGNITNSKYYAWGSLNMLDSALVFLKKQNVSTDEFYPYGILLSKSIYDYDEDYNLIGIRDYNYSENGSKSSEIRYKYNWKGKKIEETWYNSNTSELFKLEFSYSLSGNAVIVKVSNYDKGFNSLERHILDKYGNIIEYYEGEDSKDLELDLIFKYEYDSVGNWVKRMQFSSDGEPELILERDIIYF